MVNNPKLWKDKFNIDIDKLDQFKDEIKKYRQVKDDPAFHTLDLADQINELESIKPFQIFIRYGRFEFAKDKDKSNHLVVKEKQSIDKTKELIIKENIITTHEKPKF